MATPARVAVVGLDCGTPELLFDRHADDMPTLRRLTGQALWGPLRSVVPPITMPAWSCMAAGLTPGELGVYAFRDPSPHGDDKLAFASAGAVEAPRLWDRLGAAGRASVVLGVPGAHPPSAIQGCMVSCCTAPSTGAASTRPAEPRDELQQGTGGSLPEVTGFHGDDKARVAQQVFDLTEQRFALARHLATTRPWDLFWFVDLGPDRLHHGFWSHCDPGHPRHRPGNRYAGMFTDYYRALDGHLASFLEVLPDDTAVLVVSDHGAQPMLGGFRVNQWLVDQGLLVLAEVPARPTPIGQAKVDWARTTAWSDGGYYGRMFLNVEGREPEGTVPANRYEEVREELAVALESLVDHRGHRMGTRALRPEGVHPEVRGAAPDLIVYFGDLRWRAVGSVGHGPGLFTFGDGAGTDDANHAENGVFALVGDGLPSGRQASLSVYDVAPTLQRLLGLPAVPGQRGRIVA